MFLATVERQIFEHVASPYLPLFRQARCELGDLQRLVAQRGLEPALKELHDAGVYVTFEEFKGRQPIVRGDMAVEVDPDDFDNPGLGPGLRSSSGGSSGRPVRFSFDLGHMRTFLPINLLQYEALGILDAPAVSWWEDLPSATGLKAALRSVTFGHPIERWFSVPMERRPTTDARNRLATTLFVGAARVWGGAVPWPTPLALDQAGVVARWAAAANATSARSLVMTNVSRAVRVAQAARELGLDLTGTTFYGASDPPTQAKRSEIEASGARHVPNYYISEAGCVGVGCAHPIGANDVHFSRDMFGLHTVPADIAGADVSRMFLTELTGTSPKVVLNVDTGDHARVEERACGCTVGDLGLHIHLCDIFTVSKLTVEGTTLVGNDVIRILEDVLPARFGGSSLDYQLVEEEEQGGLTRLVLVVSPRVHLADESTVMTSFLEALGPTNMAEDVRSIWAAAQTLTVRRAEPTITERGKLLPLMRSNVRRDA